MRIQKADGRRAQRQAEWIVQIEPWRSLGYEKRRLAAWLAQQAHEGHVTAATGGDRVLGLIVAQPDFLLGTFIALLAVRPDAAGQGIGRALVQAVARRATQRRRWLYTSCDARNDVARRFYLRLGFERIGRLPDLIRRGRTEILWRKEVVGGQKSVVSRRRTTQPASG
jgi:ribosomal protein S18 acetylase RimI-like enzyme